MDLRDYGNFKPMITEDEYNAVQEINYGTPKAISSRKKRLTYYPFAHGFVRCDVCGGAMVPGASKSKSGTRYLYYRCTNKGCHRVQKSVRGNTIFNSLYDELNHLKFDEKHYQEYVKTFSKYSSEVLEGFRKDKRSLAGTRSAKQERLEELSDKYISLGKDANATIRQRLSSEIDVLNKQVEDLTRQIKELDEKLKNSDKAIVSRDEFLNTLNNLADKMKSGDAVEKDILARKMLLNTVIDDKNSPSFIWKEPFATLIELSKMHLGWG